MSWSGRIERVRIGIFGGTFDPPHVGHLILAAEARDQLQLDQVLWVVTPDPPHKTGRTISPLAIAPGAGPGGACQGSPVLRFRGWRLTGPGPHYSVDTVQILARENPGAELFYLMGGDSLHDLPDLDAPAGVY